MHMFFSPPHLTRNTNIAFAWQRVFMFVDILFLMCLVVWRVYLGSCVHRSMESSSAALQRLQYGSQSNMSGNVLDNLNAALGKVLSG